LGLASALYAALRLKSPQLAAHGLRVALTVSGWGQLRGMEAATLELAEIAALLHDIGMIAVPDHILRKSQPLERPELLLLDAARHHSLELLRLACGDERLLTIVEEIGVWYDGTRSGNGRAGEALSLPARMITIAEAFDAMITHQVYRPAMSVERAVAELHRCAGSQFDPALVSEFASQVVGQLGWLQTRAACRWLGAIDPGAVDSYWRVHMPEMLPGQLLGLFPSRLLEHMRDGVIFVDAAGRIVGWNQAAERLSGVPAAAVLSRAWAPSLLGLRDERGNALDPQDCPLQTALRCGAQSLRRLTLERRSGRRLPVDVHAIPVFNEEGVRAGAILLVHDASPEASWEAECHRLQARTALDPLTGLANRAELQRVLQNFVVQHQQQGLPCSLIVCDLDHFKQINDTYGHQAGDEVLKAFAAVLRAAVRSGDLAARYGGEEFVLLCANCDNAAAMQRAEQIRFRFAQTPQPALGNKTVTASFGVTELQPGDTPESFFRRADRALLAAKINGRNQVVQLGVGSQWEEPSPASPYRGKPGRDSSPNLVLNEQLRIDGPLNLVVEKLRGFVSDHQARVVLVADRQVELEIEHRPAGMRRRGDRPITFRMELIFHEVAGTATTGKMPAAKVTLAEVRLRPASGRERRRQEILSRARAVIDSLRAYLIAVPHRTIEQAPSAPKKWRLPWPFHK
jgi:diguanylate cyclase (GGDEF)-like protein/PAS domain S-box-containing protein